MDAENLVKMANQIGDFFASFPDRGEALDGIAGHIRKFWAPRMRQQLLAYIDASGAAAGLSPLVSEAVSTHREQLA